MSLPASPSPVNQERSMESSSSEDLFVEIFQEVLGFERAQLLLPQYPVKDIYDRGRFIDFAFISRLGKYAFEIDGEVWHAPDGAMVNPQAYRDQLLRQNSLVYQGWKVYRWTDVQLDAERERIQEQLLLFLEREITQGTLDGFLPKQEAGEISLKEHQVDALKQLEELRSQGKTITLLTHATGTGKTHIAISDAHRLGLRTLYLAHRKPLVTQTQERFLELWPDATTAIFQKKTGKPDTQVVLSTIQAIANALDQFDEREFGYIIIDESHHAAAETYRKVISHFRAKFILGLTATPERYDGQSLIEIFQNCAHRLELEEAIQRRLLVPIRCIRVKTNVDLTKVRFNGVDYRSSDLGKALQVPDRDRLIVETYINHASGKRAVCFCIDVNHAERMAELFQQNNVAAAHVSGRMSDKQKDQILADYRSGKIHVLCACDILNEGWDSPETEVLLMARPTLSKVVYVQQLGRGTRTAPGKEYLLVFDFIDNTSRYNQALNTHRLFKNPRYRPGGLVAAPSELLTEEEATYARGEKPTAVLGLHLWVDKYEAIDIFRWQDEVKDMYQTRELEAELGVSDNVVKNWVKTGRLIPDHTIPVGSQTYYYFRKDRLEEIRQQFKLTAVTKDNIKDKFIEFVTEMDMRYSYKPVLLLGLLELADDSGKVAIPELVSFFRDFYLKRLQAGLAVEKTGSRMERVAELSDREIEAIMLAHPFEKFERRKFVLRLKELTQLKFNPMLWKRLSPADKVSLKQCAETALAAYYQSLS
ncbi:MAG: DEAD/DEAH box helicase family protein [Cyanobacteria bacterium]|nr:DEAD/DEAH box helicase family protein [Cyanobacteriota bacterium]MDW8200277.1 DEAD/DEAH box helicase family protein [Cyanobacteriota bacterium SKYGB_h_bin112]